jgi:hypothetical protein
LLPICAHDDAGYPADNTANDKPYNKVHLVPSLRAPGMHESSVLYKIS